MLEMNKPTKRQPQQGIVVSDPKGVVIAWPDGLARWFSWDQLRQLSMKKDLSEQSAPHKPHLPSPLAPNP